MSINHFRKNAGSSFFTFIGVSALVAILAGCSQTHFSGATSSFLSGMSSDIFSNRPQMQDKSIVLIQFTNPPLLTSVQMQDGKKVVDANLKKAIADEQAAAEVALKKMSSDISILFRYKMVLNGFAVIAPNSLLDQLKGIGGISYVEGEGSFARPIVLDATVSPSGIDIVSANSVKFIGADVVHQMKVKNAKGEEVPLDGTGMRVGIIDTGIDYTHAMFAGPGTEASYKSIDPAAENTLFPSAKVVGGIDLVGTNYNSGATNLKDRLPVPDANPLDEAGHGSHVAGTVAGKGDGVNTYDGVAPGASLYAIKVFGAEGSTGDAVVIEGLEFAADPTGTGDPSQQLDAVNLSLGGPYGSPHLLYQQAIGNLTKAGTVVLCAAGNEGPLDYIVGAPSVADDSFSIAASIDNAPQNWQFPAVRFSYSDNNTLLTEALEAAGTKSLVQVGSLNGPIVYVGLADADFDASTAAAVKGKIAFIDRGSVSFNDKFKRAQSAGAIGVIVDNNQDGDPISMSATGPFDFPAVMISQAAGAAVKEQLKAGSVSVNMTIADKIEKKSLIDTITSFSSKGPRSQDSFIKPEVSAPGQNVVSVQMGKGNLGVQMSGTSMATPHMTGVMTILKQEHPDLSVEELKSLAMSTAKSISDVQGNEYPVSIQGAGRVQLDKAVLAEAVTVPAAVSLGEQNVATVKSVPYQIVVKNISSKEITFTPSFRARVKGIAMAPAAPLTLAPGKSGAMRFYFTLNATVAKGPSLELDGFVTLKTGSVVDLTLPVLAVIKKISNIKAEQLQVMSSVEDAQGAAVNLKVKNSGSNPGDVLIFNLLGFDARKPNPGNSPFVDTSCSLQAAGYRLIKKTNGTSAPRLFLQVAAKLYQAEDTWNTCEISVLIDQSGKGVPTQELAGITLNSVSGLSAIASGNTFQSVLFDAAMVRALRLKYEQDSQKPVPADGHAPIENYIEAVEDLSSMMVVNHSTVAVVEVPVEDLATNSVGQLSIRVATISDTAAVNSDDFLEQSPKQWTTISLQEASQAYLGMPESVTLNPKEEKTIALTKGAGSQGLLVLYPENANVYSDLVRDGQAALVKPSFAN